MDKPKLPPYQRKCENWLHSFKEWTLDRCESAESYVFWTGIFCLSAAMRRKIFIGKKYLGAWTCYPHCYIIFVGPAGVRKTTTMGYAIDLLDQIPTLPKASTFITQAALVDSIVKSPDASIYLTVEEFGDVIIKGGHEMFEFLTSMFDGKKNIEQKTMARGIEYADKPTINMLAATTPEWIAANMPEAVIGGGFASRVLFQYESDTRMTQLWYHKQQKVKDYTKLEQDLVADLQHIVLNIEGEFEIDDKALIFMEDWNQKAKAKAKNASKKLQGFYNRKTTYVLKLAQLFHISYSDDLILYEIDFQSAISFIESLEKNLSTVFSGVGKNEYSLDMRDIVAYVDNHPGISRDELFRNFINAASPLKLDELVTGLLTMGMLETKLGEGNVLTFYKK